MHIRDRHGSTALHRATQTLIDFDEVSERYCLIDSQYNPGCDLNSALKPLIIATRMVEALRNAGGSLNIENSDGMTPWMMIEKDFPSWAAPDDLKQKLRVLLM